MTPCREPVLPALPIHPHNVFLEIWLELGIPGVILFGAVIVAGTAALLAARLSRWGVAAAAATAVAVFVTAMVETSLWQVWRHGAIVIAVLYVALAERLAAPVGGGSGPRRGAPDARARP